MRSLPEVAQEMIVTPQQLVACCAQLAQSPVLGFDTEFVGEQTYQPRLCLIQAATASHLFLIDPLTVGPLDAFWKILIDPQHLTIVHAGRQDVHLCRMWAGQPPGRIFDLQIAAGLVGPVYPIGHGTLVAKELGIQIAKGETLTEWGDRPLTPKQIRYAYEDVKYLLVLQEILAARLHDRNRTAWAEEEFQWMKSDVRNEEAIREKWNKLRGLGGLDRRTLAAVRALFTWREDAAAEHNRPPRTSCATISSSRSPAACPIWSAILAAFVESERNSFPPFFKLSKRRNSCPWIVVLRLWNGSRSRPKCP